MLNCVFCGGGSQRLIPIIRELFGTPEIFDGGSIRLLDIRLDRAENIGKLLQACPEFKKNNCRIVWTDCAEEALEGADIVYMTMAARREPSWTQAIKLGIEHKYIVSDQLSINGAFLSARLGGTIMDMARKMEKYCPQATMLIFPNPVAAYAAAVNNHTKIRALGICGGFGNHRYDLTRILLGCDEYDPRWNVVAAGVNHLSFILRGEYCGQDLEKMMREKLTPKWRGARINSLGEMANRIAEEGNRRMVDVYRRYGSMIFSSEGDGMSHVLWDWALRCQREQFDPLLSNCSLDSRYQMLEAAAAGRIIPDWDAALAKSCGSIEDSLFRAFCGIKPMRIVASGINRSAITGFPERNVMEFTMDIFKDQVTPVPDQFIPHPFQGLIGSLAEFHTLLGDAAATQDGRLFADALEAYPMNKFLSERKAYFTEMFKIFDDLSPAMKNAVNYIM